MDKLTATAAFVAAQRRHAADASGCVEAVQQVGMLWAVNNDAPVCQRCSEIRS